MDKYSNSFGVQQLLVKNTCGIKSHNDKELISYEIFKENNQIYHYRPFDDRFIDYDRTKVLRHRFEVMKNITNKENISIITTRQLSTFDFQHIFLSKRLIDINSISLQTKEISYIFPVYLYPDSDSQLTLDSKVTRTPNLDMKIVQQIASGLRLSFVPEKPFDSAQGDRAGAVCYAESVEVMPEYRQYFAPIDLLDYIYAVLHSPTYRETYKEFLKMDFPRVPYPDDALKFWKLVALGGELRQLHLMESPTLSQYITEYPVSGGNEVEKPVFVIAREDSTSLRGGTTASPELVSGKQSVSDRETASTATADLSVTGRVYINTEQYFDSVPEVAWNFYIGGYQPAQKWLKDRKGRVLEFEDILHYQKIIKALVETDRVMKEIDGIVIE